MKGIRIDSCQGNEVFREEIAKKKQCKGVRAARFGNCLAYSGASLSVRTEAGGKALWAVSFRRISWRIGRSCL